MSIVYRTLLSEYKYVDKELQVKRLGILYAVSVKELISGSLITESCAGRPQAVWKTGDIQSIQADSEFYRKLAACKFVQLPVPKGFDLAGISELTTSIVKGLDWTDEDFPEDEPPSEKPVVMKFIYRVEFARFEWGWHGRVDNPDSILYAVTREDLQEGIKAYEAKGTPELYYLAKAIGQCMVTETFFKEVAEKKTVTTFLHEHEGVIGRCTLSDEVMARINR